MKHFSNIEISGKKNVKSYAMKQFFEIRGNTRIDACNETKKKPCNNVCNDTFLKLGKTPVLTQAMMI